MFTPENRLHPWAWVHTSLSVMAAALSPLIKWLFVLVVLVWLKTYEMFSEGFWHSFLITCCSSYPSYARVRTLLSCGWLCCGWCSPYLSCSALLSSSRCATSMQALQIAVLHAVTAGRYHKFTTTCWSNDMLVE